jgi:hypothetical protein
LVTQAKAIDYPLLIRRLTYRHELPYVEIIKATLAFPVEGQNLHLDPHLTALISGLNQSTDHHRIDPGMYLDNQILPRLDSFNQVLS